MVAKVRERITEIANQNMELRHDLHRHPQTGFEETYAHETITTKLDMLGIPYEVVAGTGIVATIEGKQNTSGKTIGLRVDMDALNVEETSGVEWSSQNPGKMHACGHDGHMTIGITAAEYLAETRNFNGVAKVVFQPAEEGVGGSKAMIQEGLHEKHTMDSIYAIHNWPTMDLGEAAIHKGPVMAGNSNFKILIKGKSAHGALPEQGNNPIPIAMRIGGQLDRIKDEVAQSYPDEKFVLSLCSIESGDSGSMSAIPDDALMTGTIRAYNCEMAEEVRARVEHIAQAIVKEHNQTVAHEHKAEAEIVWPNISVPTINTEASARVSHEVMAKILGHNRVAWDAEPAMTADDFGANCGYVLPNGETVGISYIWLGQRDPDNPDGPTGQGLHNSSFGYNDDLTPIAAEYMAGVIEAEMPLEPETP